MQHEILQLGKVLWVGHYFEVVDSLHKTDSKTLNPVHHPPHHNEQKVFYVQLLILQRRSDP
jgi:hypothetical protein